MFRKRAWRKTVNDAVNWHQDQALSTTIFILTESGPTGFLLKENGESKNYKVCLGDPHTCTCATFQKEKDLCKHICWILMRKFRLPRDHEYCFQSGLVDRQILEVLQGLYRARTPRPADSSPSAPSQPGTSGEDGTVRQKAIGEDDVCPICQEELMKKKLPVTYCRFGCGNNVHISCVKVWADYQARSETDVMVKCPLCRETFGSLKLLLEQVKNVGKLCTASERERLDKHLGIPCNNCRVCPIVGKCFKCTICNYFHLCEDCFKRSCHPQHSFTSRTKRNQPWQLVEQGVAYQSSKALLIHSQLMPIKPPDVLDVVPEHVLRSLPVMRVRQSSKLLELGMQCRFCLQSFRLGQYVRTLPCRHKFHADCIEMWLRQSVCCPLDWHVIYNPLTWNSVAVQAPGASSNGVETGLPDQPHTQLFIPGFGLLDRAAKSTERSDILSAGLLDPLSTESITQGTQTLFINNTNSGMNTTESRHRESRSNQSSSGLGLVWSPVSAPRRKLGVKTSFPGRKQNIFPKLNEHTSEAQPKNSALPGHFRPLRLGSGSIRHQPSGDLSSLDLWVTSIPVSAKHPRNQE